MAIVESHKSTFIIKFIILFPLSWVMIFVAFLYTGGGHGNFLPLQLIVGPAFLLAFLPNDVLIMLGAACLYPAYALLLHFVKVRGIPVILAIIHVACAAALLHHSNSGPSITEPYSLMLLAIIIWMLISIRRESVKASPKKSFKVEDNTK